jgi:competence ComEA-like helix-hairpin-helix protein
VPFASRAQLCLTVLGCCIGAIAIARHEHGVYAQAQLAARVAGQHQASAKRAARVAAERALPLDLNAASAEELTRLPGVGPKLAERIVAHRAAHGPFPRLADVDVVAGVGAKLLAKLAPHVRVEARQNSSNNTDARSLSSLPQEGAPSGK